MGRVRVCSAKYVRARFVDVRHNHERRVVQEAIWTRLFEDDAIGVYKEEVLGLYELKMQTLPKI